MGGKKRGWLDGKRTGVFEREIFDYLMLDTGRSEATSCQKDLRKSLVCRSLSPAAGDSEDRRLRELVLLGVGKLHTCRLLFPRLSSPEFSLNASRCFMLTLSVTNCLFYSLSNLFFLAEITGWFGNRVDDTL